MAGAEEWAAQRGAAGLELHVWEFNAEAIAFYRRQGYSTAGRRMWRRLPGRER